MKIQDIRRNNLRLLSKEYKSQRNLADAADLSYAHLNNIIGKTPVRNCGERLARKIEQMLNLPFGWLDKERSKEMKSTSVLSDVPLVKITSIGNVFAFSEQHEQSIFSKQWLLENHYQSGKIVAWEMIFDNMTPSIRIHDLLAIDLSQTDIVNGGIYLFVMNGEIMLRRFTKQIDSVKLTVDSAEQALYPVIELHISQISVLHIIGKVVSLYRKL